MDKSTEHGPNILVTGTPGTGKSTLCSSLAESTALEWIDINEVAKEQQLYEGYDSVYECQVLDEDRLLDELEDRMREGGKIVDYHGCDFFPERWFDIVFVLTTDNTVLFDRLKTRGYSEKKLQDNLQCEIFHTLADEAKQSYRTELIHLLPNNTTKDLDENVERITQWVYDWNAQHGNVF